MGVAVTRIRRYNDEMYAPTIRIRSSVAFKDATIFIKRLWGSCAIPGAGLIAANL